MRRVLLAWFAVLALVAGCAGTPPPDWAIAAQGSLQRAVGAYLSGRGDVEAVEFARARHEIARTGRVDLLARAELTRCATRVASLVFEPCAGFEALRADAPAAERAYADFLAGRVASDDIALLPPQHRAVAAAGAPVPLPDAEPLAQLVAAGVLLQTGRADARVVEQAVDTASSQGWRRPLLAWLGVQQRLAEQAGDSAEAARIARRIDLVADDGRRAPH
jgi:hypothetical protein